MLPSVDAIQKAGGPKKYIALQLQKKPDAETPTLRELSRVHAVDTQLYPALLPMLQRYCIWAHFFDGEHIICVIEHQI